mmetsp:Transcript_14222/g.44868  ORF Transcript_14222/g.44868 Transcript_14222/m.44868 type:complete len:121 (+) Transcript_14222:443-805(+)
MSSPPSQTARNSSPTATTNSPCSCKTLSAATPRRSCSSGPASPRRHLALPLSVSLALCFASVGVPPPRHPSRLSPRAQVNISPADYNSDETITSLTQLKAIIRDLKNGGSGEVAGADLLI